MNVHSHPHHTGALREHFGSTARHCYCSRLCYWRFTLKWPAPPIFLVLTIIVLTIILKIVLTIIYSCLYLALMCGSCGRFSPCGSWALTTGSSGLVPGSCPHSAESPAPSNLPIFIFFSFQDSVSLCSPDYPGMLWVDQAGLECVETCLPLPPLYWDVKTYSNTPGWILLK